MFYCHAKGVNELSGHPVDMSGIRLNIFKHKYIAQAESWINPRQKKYPHKLRVEL